MKAIFIGNSREVFWDSFLIDPEHTTALWRMHSPQRREPVICFDRPWEGSHCYFINMFRDGDRLRMYYHASGEGAPAGVRICLAESHDGLRWEKPSLGICAFQGSRENNIVLDASMIPELPGAISDNLFVFRDSNPDCPEEERYKGVCGIVCQKRRYLRCFVSPDGVHFRYGWELYERPMFFDSLNTAHYDPVRKKYFCYFRGWHRSELTPAGAGTAGQSKDLIRDIRVMESEDFRHWSEPEPLAFGEDSRDFHLYTNGVEPYYRARHILVGFPARYTDRYAWSANYDRLCGREERLERMKGCPRFGLTVTDCLFMCSRDGRSWFRPDEAFLRPGPENDWSWRYGDCFLNAGMFETPSAYPGEAPELSFLSPTKRWTQEASGNLLVRYGLRVDGFASRWAGYAPRVLTTKPIVFSGSRLSVNFETSAAGSMLVELTDGNGKPLDGFRSCELFGNSIDRTVDFEGDLRTLAGKPVRLRIILSDADVYSFRFSDAEEEACAPCGNHQGR